MPDPYKASWHYTAAQAFYLFCKKCIQLRLLFCNYIIDSGIFKLLKESWKIFINIHLSVSECKKIFIYNRLSCRFLIVNTRVIKHESQSN